MRANERSTYEGALAIPAGRSGDWAVEHVEHGAGHAFPLATSRTAIIGGHRGGRVAFDHPTRWHRLTEGSSVWMSDYPIEQVQHDRELAGVRAGRVLVGGLGLGYAATVLARRPRVTEVVAVERSADVVALVVPHLLADDPAARAKLTVVRADLFDYLRAVPERQRGFRFDHAFYDIWASDGETTFHQVVVPLLALSHRRVRRTPVCWNESVMRGQLRLGLVSRWHVVCGGRTLAGAPALDDLCEETDDVWRRWSAPFFRWVRKASPGREAAEESAGLYAARYGMPGFDDWWQFWKLTHGNGKGGSR